MGKGITVGSGEIVGIGITVGNGDKVGSGEMVGKGLSSSGLLPIGKSMVSVPEPPPQAASTVLKSTALNKCLINGLSPKLKKTA